jgi:hypothetical protein
MLPKGDAVSYSPFFQTLHDETVPVGNLGGGTQYSVLRVPIWFDEYLNPLQEGALLDFAVIWDEDHDERVIPAIAALHFAALLGPVRFIGERKGSLTVLIDPKAVKAWSPDELENYRAAVSKVSQSMDDPWTATVDTVLGTEHMIVHAPRDHVVGYLKNIEVLWRLGRKPYQLGAATE